MESEKKSPTPPYVPYKTLANFLEKFKQGIPGRVDRDLMGKMSGAAQSQVTTALKYLGFISENNIPSPLMKQYVTVEEGMRKKLLHEIIAVSYPFLFNGALDLSSATASQLREAFEENTGASGETVNRCIVFFKDAAVDSGMKISPYITQKKPRSATPRKRIVAPSAKQSIAAMAENSHKPNLHFNPDGKPPIAAQGSLLLWGLFERLPKPGTVWPKEERDQWTQTLHNVLTLEYKDQ